MQEAPVSSCVSLIKMSNLMAQILFFRGGRVKDTDSAIVLMLGGCDHTLLNNPKERF